jgi:hypothetical protein
LKKKKSKSRLNKEAKRRRVKMKALVPTRPGLSVAMGLLNKLLTKREI